MFRMMGFLVGVLVATIGLLVLLDRADVLQAQDAAKRVTAAALQEIAAMEHAPPAAAQTNSAAPVPEPAIPEAAIPEPVIPQPVIKEPPVELPALVEAEPTPEEPVDEVSEQPLFTSLKSSPAMPQPKRAESDETELLLTESPPDHQEVVAVDPAAPNWYPLWEPFHSELSADGFARRLERLTGLDYRVASVGRGKYQVAVAHTDETDKAVALARIEAATGLRLTPELP